MSPKVQKTTSGRAAISMARSSVSSGVTQTGQPGPWTNSTPSGSARSMPNFIRLCVWPPQTSISVQGRVTVRRICSRRVRAASGARYSSRYFIDLVQDREDLPGAGRVDHVQGEPGVHHDVVPDTGLGDVGQADRLAHAAERERPLAHPGLGLLDLDDLSRNSETHGSPPPCLRFGPESAQGAGPELPDRQATV